ncbi:MAG: efflux RND transporter periplasmic adaptor subunit [Planctomycetota bacterium]
MTLLTLGQFASFSGATESIIPYGLAKPLRIVEVSPRIPGVLIESALSPGQHVQEGDILGIIDHSVALATVRAAEAAAMRSAEIEQSRHRLAFAEKQFQRYQRIQDGNAIAEVEFDNASAQLKDAQTQLSSALEKRQQAIRNLELEEARLERHNIRAPFQGQVVAVHAVEGSSLTLEDSLLTLIDHRQLELELYLTKTTVETLRIDGTYDLHAMSPVDKTVQARLTFISPVIESSTGTFRTVFLIDNADSKLPAGIRMRLVHATKSTRRSLSASEDAKSNEN